MQLVITQLVIPPMLVSAAPSDLRSHLLVGHGPERGISQLEVATACRRALLNVAAKISDIKGWVQAGLVWSSSASGCYHLGRLLIDSPLAEIDQGWNQVRLTWFHRQILSPWAHVTPPLACNFYRHCSRTAHEEHITETRNPWRPCNWHQGNRKWAHNVLAHYMLQHNQHHSRLGHFIMGAHASRNAATILPDKTHIFLG